MTTRRPSYFFDLVRPYLGEVGREPIPDAQPIELGPGEDGSDTGWWFFYADQLGSDETQAAPHTPAA